VSVISLLYALEIQSLIEKSFEAKKLSYSPYSKFPVGAALLCQDGTVVTGQFLTWADNSHNIINSCIGYVLKWK